MVGLTFTNNILNNGPYGIIDLTWVPSTFLNPVIKGNALVTGLAADYVDYSSSNYFPPSYDIIGFVNYNGGLKGDYHLGATSAYRQAGTDGRDLGADIDLLNAAMATSTVQLSVADTTPPTLSLTSPAAGATVSGLVSISATAADNVGVQRVEFWVSGLLSGVSMSAPYTYLWDTTLGTNSAYTLQARVYDAAGNSATDSRAVTVYNAQSPSAVHVHGGAGNSEYPS